ncbi:hypothetical protein A3A71_02005 [Candidatus Berkelbacteria bacterium RIFCSPLOWO2_01_FULL_50_28]|uniref:Elp3/MiaA/NifB-like radical SAM core domain-containing protein n=1 Tax=Candidatus Berkelbacteria bacterium RIFCSPLOWO2_01_FULL_50_28 TaxID=1797471 RepID=A0A1F5EBL0_9BACT|nr:MAG: hypothetical protein A2807_00400 [Candidatus Berkelbacteria bacterium RIFCSPHIGHO2_01_FULL_50_36]OGD64797.1 MAG: hypothetical protein A3A71_02005 [Candidatus Berkelbacteria bacterium RIFCSPLOWO2_01_FULL_50_28]
MRTIFHILLAVVVVCSLFQVNTVVPEYKMYGSAEFIHYDASTNEFVNNDPGLAMWRASGDVIPNTHPGCFKRVPAKEQLNITFRPNGPMWRRAWPLFLVGMATLRPIYVHARPDRAYEERFDTLLMVNGSVAVLNQVTIDLLGYPGLAIDETFVSSDVAEGEERPWLLNYLRNHIQEVLDAGDEPVIFCTLLSYNACGSLDLLRQLKADFGDKLRTGVGGQLVRVCPSAYLSQPYIDHVGVGDAEAVLGELLLNGKKFAEGYKPVTREDHYALPHYDNLLALPERLTEMSHYDFGPMVAPRMLITESCRGCAWANAVGAACPFCSLQGVEWIARFRNFEDHFAIERELVEKYGANWLFDVSNQWIPEMGSAQRMWLESYIKAKKKYGGPEVGRYVYLTAGSINEHTAPLLPQTGVKVAYVGIDGWDKETKRALGKQVTNDRRMLQLARDNGIFIRTSMVIGSGLTLDNIEELPRYVKATLDEFGGNTILSWGNFIEIVLPGSQDWSDFRKLAYQNGLTDVQDLYRSFETNGCLTLDEQDKLNELRIRHTQPQVAYEQVLEAARLAEEAALQSLAYSTTIRHGDKLMRKD